jgi:hypothetical protein
VIARTGVAIAVVACAFATACTAYVAGQLKGLDDYPADGAVGNTASACSLIKDEDANACNDCITQSCADDVAYACNGGSYKTWFYQMRDCAESPALGTQASTNYRCDTYNEPDAEANTANDDPGHERQALICIRDKCLGGGNRVPAPCRQCVVSTSAPGSSSQTVHLEDTPCGQCIANACKAQLARCCDYSLSELAQCGYTSDPDFARRCHQMITWEGGTRLADASCDANTGGPDECVSGGCNGHCSEPTYTTQCAFDISECGKTCASSCP